MTYLKTEYTENDELRIVSHHGEIGRFRRLAPATPMSFVVTDPNLTLGELSELGEMAKHFLKTTFANGDKKQ